MSNFWPYDFQLEDVESPLEILRQAQNDWKSNSGGALELSLQTTTTQSGNELIIVHVRHLSSKKSAELFSVMHRPDESYPLTILPKEDELPNTLKKQYEKVERKPSLREKIGFLSETESQTTSITVRNKWVANTPSEFREKLEEVFQLGFVKSIVINLIANKSTKKIDT